MKVENLTKGKAQLGWFVPSKLKTVVACRLVVFACLFLGAVTAQAQPREAKVGSDYFVVPSDHILLLVASQPSAPICFENAQLLMSRDGRDVTITYRVRNVGSKTIRYVNAVMWTSFGTGGTIDTGGETKILIPGEVSNHTSSKHTFELSRELREKLALIAPMKALVVLMAETVTFVDGTKWDDQPTSKALLRYFESVVDKLEQLQNIKGAGNPPSKP